MFFSSIFAKNHTKLTEKADRLYAAGHFADARHNYLEALEKIDAGASGDDTAAALRQKIALASDRLAELNINEADAAFRAGNGDKAAEHLQLALELANDAAIRARAESCLQQTATMGQQGSAPAHEMRQHNCASCATSSAPATGAVSLADSGLNDSERFQLLANTLPGDLPQRYCQQGVKFASAYLLAHDEKLPEALEAFIELLAAGESDILLYETALLYFRSGQPVQSEQLMKRAIRLNSTNPLCHLGIAQLYAGTGRYQEAIAELASMIENEMLTDQALVMLGDIHALTGDLDKAIEVFTPGLNSPALKRVSAERLVQILTAAGREPEAAFVAKTYLKGCC